MESLDEIGLRAGTDKSSHDHNYLNFYERNLCHLKNERFFLLEIGVHKARSLITWATYFPNAQIVGLDIDKEAAKLALPPNAKVRIGDAGRLEFLDDVVAEFGAPLIVLDDGSHYWHHQIEALRYLWPRVRNGGAFIVEDIHTSFPGFQPQFTEVSFSDVTCYDYLLKLNRWVVGSRFMGGEKAPDGFISNYWPTVESMYWYRGTCVINKKSAVF